MDSFYDAPRRPPQFIRREALAATPVVPDISVICASKPQKNAFTSYNQWRTQQTSSQQAHFRLSNKENFNVPNSPQNASILKKQVRFESPVLTSIPICDSNTNLLQINDNKKVEITENEKSKPNFEQIYMANIPNRKLDLSVIDLPKTLNKKVVAAQVSEDKIKLPTETKSVEPKIVLNDSVTDIFNYKRPIEVNDIQTGQYHPILPKKIVNHERRMPLECRETFPNVLSEEISSAHSRFTSGPPINQHNILTIDRTEVENATNPRSIEHFSVNYDSYTPKIIPETVNNKIKCCCCEESSKKNQKLSAISSDEVCVKDLLQIIKQQSEQIAKQNEQLLLLQKQISTLILRENDHKKIHYALEDNNRQLIYNSEVLRNNGNQNKCITSTQHENYKENVMNKPNFSIGVMTSFEVSIRNSPNKNPHNGANIGTKSPRIEEIPEPEPLVHKSFNDNNKTLADVSMLFKEPIKIREQCPSPEPSIKITMNDFEDSDCEEENSEAGATFYNNLMTQVNKILQKAQIQTQEQLSHDFQGQNAEVVANKLKNETLHKVKEVTLKHLKNIGIDVPSFKDSSSCLSDDPESKSYAQEDISYTVKQLLMKYLPDEHLAKISKKIPYYENPAMLTPKEKIGAIKNRPEFSFATVQYMKKYNLISNDQKDNKPPTASSPKILDVTKLKQQPKLL